MHFEKRKEREKKVMQRERGMGGGKRVRKRELKNDKVLRETEDRERSKEEECMPFLLWSASLSVAAGALTFAAKSPSSVARGDENESKHRLRG